MNRPDVTGSYDVAGLEFSVAEREGRLLMIQPEVPQGFEPVLEWTGTDSLEITSGPWAGTAVEVEQEHGRAIRLLAGGVIPIERTSRAPASQPGTGLLAPDYPADPKRDSVFEAAWKQKPSEGFMSAPSQYPTHLFVRWLMEKEAFIFHGSNRLDIESFQPVRESMEIANRGGHGNLGAVYGTHDALWAMFFAIVDRARARGSIRNGVATYTSTGGASVDLYQFSIEHQSLRENPFQSGALYILPRDRFERIPLYPGGPPTNEWACFETIQPIASISVEPQDFPFLDEIGGHNDDDLLRFSSLQSEIRAHVIGVVRIDNGVRVDFDSGLNPEERDDWLELGRRMFPDVKRIVIDRTTVELSGPAAFVHSVEQEYKEWLAETD